jgi:hypothetical protein
MLSFKEVAKFQDYAWMSREYGNYCQEYLGPVLEISQLLSLNSDNVKLDSYLNTDSVFRLYEYFIRQLMLELVQTKPLYLLRLRTRKAYTVTSAPRIECRILSL